MRRSRLLLAVTAAGSLVGGVVMSAPASARADRTAAYGAFGFTTTGLGATGSYGEPSLAIHKDGKHLAVSTPGCAAVCYWYSSNNGKTWGHTETPGGGGDSELDFLPDGTLISADLAIQNSIIRRSKDFGKTWDEGREAGTEQDRQWFAHTPDGKRAFLVYHDFAAEAELISESKDKGKTWTTAPQDQIVVQSADQAAVPNAGNTGQGGGSASLIDQGVNTFSGPMLVDNNGKDFYVVYSISDVQSNSTPLIAGSVPPFGAVRSVVVAHSADAGKTWTNKYAVAAKPNPDARMEEQNGTMFPWGFLDQAGTVYVVFDSTRDDPGTENYHYYYTYSKDKGTTWSKPKRIDGLPKGKGSVVFNTGAAVKPGVIDVAWLQNDTDVLSGNSSWYTWFAQITKADTRKAVVKRQKVSKLPMHKGGVCIQGILCGIAPGSGDRSLADFIELAVNPKTKMATIAYGDNAGARPDGTKGEVVVAMQTKQPSKSSLVPVGLPSSTPWQALPWLGFLVCMGLLLKRSRIAVPAPALA